MWPWVTFDQHAPETGDPFDVAGLQHNLRIMAKHAGEWKIACVSVLQPFPERADYPVVRVDEHAAVLWMNRHAQEQLRSHKGLIVSGGRLRARNRPAQKGLQAAIRWAADVVELAERQAAARGALAVNLGDDDGASVQICWVTSDSGMVLVSFDDAATMQRRLSPETEAGNRGEDQRRGESASSAQPAVTSNADQVAEWSASENRALYDNLRVLARSGKNGRLPECGAAAQAWNEWPFWADHEGRGGHADATIRR